jgi:hypothetical protein
LLIRIPFSTQALALMANKEAVAAILVLLVQTANVATERHVIVGLILKFSSIPAFAEEVRPSNPAP